MSKNNQKTAIRTRILLGLGATISAISPLQTSHAKPADPEASQVMVEQMKSAVARIAEMHSSGDYGFVVSNVEGFASMVKQSLERTADAEKLERELAGLRRSLVMARNDVSKAEANLEGLRTRELSYAQSVAKLQARESEIASAIAEKSKAIARADATIEAKEKAIERLNEMVASVEESIGVAEAQMEDTSQRLAALARREDAMRTRLTRMQKALAGANTMIAGVLEDSGFRPTEADEVEISVAKVEPTERSVNQMASSDEEDSALEAEVEVAEVERTNDFEGESGREPDMLDISSFTQRVYGGQRSKTN